MSDNSVMALMSLRVSAEVPNSAYSTIRVILTTYNGEPFSDTSGHWYLKIFNPETLEAEEQPLSTDNPDGWPNTIGCPLFKNCSVEYGYRTTGTGEILFKKNRNIKARQHRQEITLKIPNKMSVDWEVNLLEKTEDGKRPIEESMCVSLFKPSEDILGTPQYSKCGISPIKFTIVPGTYKISVRDQENLQIFNRKVMENVPIFKSRTSNYNLTRAGKALVTFQFDKPLQADAEVYFDNGTVEKYSLAKGIDKETYEVREGPTKITVFFGTYTEDDREKGGHTFIRQYLIKANSSRLIQLHENYDYLADRGKIRYQQAQKHNHMHPRIRRKGGFPYTGHKPKTKDGLQNRKYSGLGSGHLRLPDYPGACPRILQPQAAEQDIQHLKRKTHLHWAKLKGQDRYRQCLERAASQT